jgi:excisionase family DNA binding protein
VKLSKTERDAIAKVLMMLVEQPDEAEPPALVERRTYTPKEIAKRNSFSVSYVYGQIQKGSLRATRAGGTGQMRVTPEDEAAWLQA